MRIDEFRENRCGGSRTLRTFPVFCTFSAILKKFGTREFHESFLSDCEFCENQRIDSHT